LPSGARPFARRSSAARSAWGSTVTDLVRDLRLGGDAPEADVRIATLGDLDDSAILANEGGWDAGFASGRVACSLMLISKTEASPADDPRQ
jgi:hypothetical protein